MTDTILRNKIYETKYRARNEAAKDAADNSYRHTQNEVRNAALALELLPDLTDDDIICLLQSLRLAIERSSNMHLHDRVELCVELSGHLLHLSEIINNDK